MIKHRYFTPSAPLRGSIVCFEVIENTNVAQEGSLQRVTPEGCLELNFNLADPLLRTADDGEASRLDGCYAVSRASRSYFVQRTGAARVASVRFHPWGAHQFTPMPMDLLADSAVDGIELFGSGIRELHDRLGEIPDADVAVAELDRFFFRALGTARATDPLVEDAVRRMAQAKGALTMCELHARYGITPRRMQQRFKTRIGMSPKHYARLMRFQHALFGLLKGDPSMDVAFTAGYFDQPHFVREFTAFAGISPSRYVKEAHPLNDAMLLGASAAAVRV